jgi:hypothetical protein
MTTINKIHHWYETPLLRIVCRQLTTATNDFWKFDLQLYAQIRFDQKTNDFDHSCSVVHSSTSCLLLLHYVVPNLCSLRFYTLFFFKFIWFQMSSTQLKLDQLWSRHEPSSKPPSFSNTDAMKVFSLFILHLVVWPVILLILLYSKKNRF